MTGKDLIIYILKHGLENEEIVKDGRLTFLLTIDEVAAKFNVGVATVEVWVKEGWIDSIFIDNTRYFLKDIKDPRVK